jgi:hypothetical protein
MRGAVDALEAVPAARIDLLYESLYGNMAEPKVKNYLRYA